MYKNSHSCYQIEWSERVVHVYEKWRYSEKKKSEEEISERKIALKCSTRQSLAAEVKI